MYLTKFKKEPFNAYHQFLSFLFSLSLSLSLTVILTACSVLLFSAEKSVLPAFLSLYVCYRNIVHLRTTAALLQ